MRKYVLISDFNLRAFNRGTAALGYGAISFLREKGLLNDDCYILNISVHLSPFHKSYSKTEMVQGKNTKFYNLNANWFEYILFYKLGLIIPFLPLGRALKIISCVAALNGGDGFSDIYGKYLFQARNPYSYIAMKANAPLIIMPQTIGPFKEKDNLDEAKRILKYASKVYVRDNLFIKELDAMGIKYELTKDLSAYMKPEEWNIDIKPGSIGINVSGLAYSNKFLDLAGQFAAYPELIDRLICHFRDIGHSVYLIPHAYNYNEPELNNDDIVACREAYNKLKDKSNVILLDQDLISPRIKYVISKMSFLCGTRMHANFAAIYTNVPVFGLSYSYKFEGAFNANGQDSKKQLATINNIKLEDIDSIICKIDSFYEESIYNNASK